MLKLSTKGRYAMRILVYMAAFGGANQSYRKHDIANAEGISEHYVEQILMKLKTGGFVRSIRGKKGGFVLDCDPARVTTMQVLETMEGPIALAPCFVGECGRRPICSTLSIWKRASDALEKVFSETTIADLAEEVRAQRISGVATFDI